MASAEIREPELSVEIEPKGPYSLALSARLGGLNVRRFRGGVLTTLVFGEDGAERVEARQRRDGVLVMSATSETGLRHLRFQLAIDDDHSGFVERFSRDRLLGRSIRMLRGLRPLRLATVSHALLRAMCGQLITAREAREIEARIVRRVSPRDPVTGLHLSPSRERLGALAPAELCRLGLGAKRATSLVRICRTLDLERLRGLPEEAAAARLRREHAVGPWSLGVVALQGLGSYRYGLNGDLELIKICSAIEGRWVTEADTERLLARYGEWAGLASVYLLRGFGTGLVSLGRAGDAGLAVRAARSSRPGASAVSGEPV
jgi:3-methyladenine DNA glycosylase/8-oxoguanine DNA glycosylase